MELLFVALGGALIGLAARYTLPGRTTQGAALLPAVATAVASVAWVVLTWFGWKWDGGWIWWVSFAVAAVVAYVTGILLARRRNQRDADMLDSLIRSGQPRTA